jgi:hypothetical protein
MRLRLDGRNWECEKRKAISCESQRKTTTTCRRCADAVQTLCRLRSTTTHPLTGGKNPATDDTRLAVTVNSSSNCNQLGRTHTTNAIQLQKSEQRDYQRALINSTIPFRCERQWMTVPPRSKQIRIALFKCPYTKKSRLKT